MTDEPLIVPNSPGTAIERLSHVAGALSRDGSLYNALTEELQEEPARPLLKARDALLSALESGQSGRIEDALRNTQDKLRQLYETMCRPGLLAPEAASSQFAALHFPDPLEKRVQPVDVSSVVATFSMPQKQVLTTLSFREAPRATAYWLHEIRNLRGEDWEDAVVECYAPLFARVRLPVGRHVLRIESRNPHEVASSERFEINVPQL